MSKNDRIREARRHRSISVLLDRSNALLLQPSPQVKTPAMHRQSTLLLTILTLLIPLWVLLTVSLLRADDYLNWRGALGVTALLSMLLAFSLAKRGRYIVAAILTSTAITCSGYGMMHGGELSVYSLAFPMLSILVAAVMLPPSGTALVVLAHLILAALLLQSQAVTQIGFHLALPEVILVYTALLMLVVMRHRDQLEQQQQQEIDASNRRNELNEYLTKVGIWHWDLLTNNVYVSPKGLAILGYPEDAVNFTPEQWQASVHPDDAAMVNTAMQNVLSGKHDQFDFEHRIFDQQGNIRWLHSSGMSVRDDTGTVIKIMGAYFNITRQKEVEAQIRQSQQELQSILDNMHDTYYCTDSEGKIIRASASAETLLGYPMAQILGNRLAEFYVHPQDRARLLALLAENNGTVKNFEAPLRRRDNSVIWVSSNTRYLRNEQGEVIGVEGTTRDITSRKLQEQELQERNELLEKVFANVHVGIAYLDTELRYIKVNEAFAALCDTAPEQLTGESHLSLFNSDDAKQLFSNIISDGSYYFGQDILCHIRGQERPIYLDVSIQPTTDQSQQVNGLVISMRNVNERKQTQSEMEKLSSALRQTADSILITDPSGTIEYVNPAFEKTTGYQLSEVLGKNPRMIKSELHDKAFYQQLWQTITGGRVYRNVVINKRKDGTLYYEEKTITPLCDTHGDIVNFISSGKDITDRMESQKRLQYLAHYDLLTELPNRALFNDRLIHSVRRAERTKETIAVLFLDIDRFKYINDGLGHDVGDQLLKAIAIRLNKCVRREDTVARLGGDEFTVLLEATNSDTAAVVAGKILRQLENSFTINNNEFYITSSIGISLFPSDAEDEKALMRHADIAMYRAKEQGGNRYHFFSSDLSANALNRLNLGNRLRQAIDRGEFQLHYQPQYHLLSGELVGIEALLRWQHPEQGIIHPDHFVKSLEETGLILPLTDWILHQACADLALWNKNGMNIPKLSVNLSSQQFYEPKFMEKLRSTLEQHAIDPRQLELEITERVIMHSTPQIEHTLNQLTNMGVSLAIDDFGIGYSSLSYLKRFPISTIKIDRSFIQDLRHNSDDGAIVKAIIAMGNKLNLNVIAEGVETEEQMQFLKDSDCVLIQGFYYSHPLPREEIRELSAHYKRFAQRPTFLN